MRFIKVPLSILIIFVSWKITACTNCFNERQLIPSTVNNDKEQINKNVSKDRFISLYLIFIEMKVSNIFVCKVKREKLFQIHKQNIINQLVDWRMDSLNKLICAFKTLKRDASCYSKIKFILCLYEPSVSYLPEMLRQIIGNRLTE